MPETTVYEVVCAECGVQTTVGVIRYPATRYEPADGAREPEECPSCGKAFDREDDWQESEPPEPEPPGDDDYDDRWREP